ncbi:hypothetical protein ACJX0J_007552, partial [Zea mays]
MNEIYSIGLRFSIVQLAHILKAYYICYLFSCLFHILTILGCIYEWTFLGKFTVVLPATMKTTFCLKNGDDSANVTEIAHISKAQNDADSDNYEEDPSILYPNMPSHIESFLTPNVITKWPTGPLSITNILLIKVSKKSEEEATGVKRKRT